MAAKKPTKTGAAKAAPDPAVSWQWDAVEFWRRVLEENAKKPLPDAADAHWSEHDTRDGSETQNLALAKLAKAWTLFENDLPPRLRSPGPNVGKFPLVALFTYLDRGNAPPLQLLLGLMESFDHYLDAKGTLTLEEAFFGKPRRNAGNFAARSAASQRPLMWAMEIAVRAADGATDIEAAEGLVKDRGLEIDPESVLRSARKHWKKDKPD